MDSKGDDYFITNEILAKVTIDPQILKTILLFWDRVVLWPSALNEIMDAEESIQAEFTEILQKKLIKFYCKDCNIGEVIQDKVYSGLSSGIYEILEKHSDELTYNPVRNLTTEQLSQIESHFKKITENSYLCNLLREKYRLQTVTHLLKEGSSYRNSIPRDMYRERLIELKKKLLNDFPKKQSDFIPDSNLLRRCLRDMCQFRDISQNSEQLTNNYLYFYNPINDELKEAVYQKKMQSTYTVEFYLPKINVKKMCEIRQNTLFQQEIQSFQRFLTNFTSSTKMSNIVAQKQYQSKIFKIMKTLESCISYPLSPEEGRFRMTFNRLNSTEIDLLQKSRLQISTLFWDFDYTQV